MERHLNGKARRGSHKNHIKGPKKRTKEDYACGVWSNDAFGDRGWLAIALVIFTIWRPNISILASFLFGGLYILYLYIPTGMDHMEYQELYKMIPYVVTLVVLVLTSMRNKRENQPPKSLGQSYFREER